MRKLTADEQKQVSFEILLYFANFCDDHKLKYYLYYGTLLGAVRHKGFIPWDDDIDVIMQRSDYSKLIELLDGKLLRGKYKLIHTEKVGAINPFVKLIDTTTLVINKNSKSDTHLWIDIFPVDNYPSNPTDGKNAIKKVSSLLLFQNAANSRIFSGSTFLRSLLKVPFSIYSHIMGASYFTEKMVQNATQFNYSGNYANLVAGDSHESPIEESDLINPVDVEFNNHLFHTVNHYQKYLSKQYGNYMELPPENKRFSHMIEAYRR